MERPDSALNVLESMDRSLLVTEEDRAHHALLHSIALDKNYIDLTNDSIIAPAVTYYMNHGSAREKLLVNYYRGVIYSNAGEAERAMKSYFEAENYIDECNDYGIAARLYTAKMSLYCYSYDFIKALDQERIAASYFLKDNDTINYIHTLNDIANLNLLLSNYNGSYQALVLIKSLKEYLDAYQKSRYFTNLLHLSRADSTFNTESVIDDYLSETVVCNYVNWIAVANAYISISDYTSAYDAVKKYRDDGGAMDAAYYWTAALVYDGLGDYQNSVISFKEYNAIIGKEIVSILESDTKFIEERYTRELELIKSKRNTERTILCLILLAVGLIWYVRRQKLTKEQYILYISEIRKQLAEAKKDDYPALKRKYLSLYKSRFETIGALCEQYIHSQDRANAQDVIYKKVVSLVDEFTNNYTDREKFEAMIDDDLDNIMSNLRAELPSLKEKDYMIFGFLVIGFDVTAISNLLNITANTVYIRKSRIRRQIEELNPEHSAQFLEVL